MENETFGSTIDRILCNFEYDGITGVGNTKNVFDKIYVSVINSFDEHGKFLNVIPIEDRENIISAYFLPWMIKYAENDINKELNRLSPHKKDAHRAIKQTIDAIKKFEDMILDNFSYLETTIKLNQEFVLESKEKDIENLKSIKKLLATTESLKNDLSKKEFKIFPKNKYLPLDRTSKKEFSEILEKLIKNYNIKGCSFSKTELIKYIVTL